MTRRWGQTPETEVTVISHNVTNYEFFYEPFYIARDDAPPHDERFLGYVITDDHNVWHRWRIARYFRFDVHAPESGELNKI